MKTIYRVGKIHFESNQSAQNYINTGKVTQEGVLKIKNAWARFRDPDNPDDPNGGGCDCSAPGNCGTKGGTCPQHEILATAKGIAQQKVVEVILYENEGEVNL